MSPPALAECFAALIEASWRGGGLILLLLAVRGLARRRIPAQVWFIAWAVVAVRLLMPFTFSVPWGAYRWPGVQGPAAAIGVPDLLKTEAVDAPPLAAANRDAKLETLPAAPARERPLSQIAAMVWIAGVALLVFLRVAASMEFRWRLRQARRLPADDVVVSMIAKKLGKLAGTGPVCLETAAVEAPALFGVFRSRLLLPPGFAAKLCEEELQFVVSHELGHWRRRDLVAQCLIQGAAMLHWFNPLVWLAVRCSRVDCELAYDEFVLRRERPAAAQAYGATLLKVLTMVQGRRRPVASVGILEDKHALGHRLRRIVDFRAAPRARMVAAVLVVMGIAAMSLTRNAQAADALPTPAPSDPSASPLPPAAAPSAAPAPASDPQAPILVEVPEKHEAALQFLRSQLERQQGRVEALTKELERYKEEHRLVSADLQQDMLNETLRAANVEAQRAATQAEAAEAHVRQIREYRKKGADLKDLPFVARQPLIAQLTQRQSANKLEAARLAERYQERHPSMVNAKNAIAATEAELTTAVEAAARQVEAEAEAAQHTLESARRAYERRAAEAQALGRVAADYQKRVRELDANERSLQATVARMEELRTFREPAQNGPSEQAGFTVSVVGAVNKQSSVTLAAIPRPIVLDAIARAGGFAEQANRSAVRILRATADGARTPIPLTEEMLMNGTGEAATLQPGDVIVVPEREAANAKSVTILGAVNNPGRFMVPAEGKLTLVDLLAFAGGQSRLADLKKVKVRRVDPQTKSTVMLTVNVDDFMRDGSGSDWSKITLEPGDIVSVPERIL